MTEHQDIDYHPYPETRPPRSGNFFVIWKGIPLGRPTVFSVAYYNAEKGKFNDTSYRGAFEVVEWGELRKGKNVGKPR